MMLFDSKGGLHTGREDIKSDPRFYRKWELCKKQIQKGLQILVRQ